MTGQDMETAPSSAAPTAIAKRAARLLTAAAILVAIAFAIAASGSGRNAPATLASPVAATSGVAIHVYAVSETRSNGGRIVVRRATSSGTIVRRDHATASVR